MIEVACICKHRFEVDDEHVGRSLKCPKCRRLVEVQSAPSPPLAVEADELDRASSPTDESRTSLATSAEIKALQSSINRLVALNQSINTRLGWVVAILTAILVRLLLRR